MDTWIVLSIGFLAQLLFSSRLIIQWINSEKQKKVSTPTLFWSLSLIASALLFVYGYLRNDFVIMLGQVLTYYIYIRNLQLQNKWITIPKQMRWCIVLSPILILLFQIINHNINPAILFKNKTIPLWLILLGVVAQLVFTFRFIYQWLYSEKKKKSTLPQAFWVLSLIGALLIITYAIYRSDYVLLVGHSFGSLIYVRNLSLLKKTN